MPPDRQKTRKRVPLSELNSNVISAVKTGSRLPTVKITCQVEKQQFSIDEDAIVCVHSTTRPSLAEIKHQKKGIIPSAAPGKMVFDCVFIPPRPLPVAKCNYKPFEAYEESATGKAITIKEPRKPPIRSSAYSVCSMDVDSTEETDDDFEPSKSRSGSDASSTPAETDEDAELLVEDTNAVSVSPVEQKYNGLIARDPGDTLDVTRAAIVAAVEEGPEAFLELGLILDLELKAILCTGKGCYGAIIPRCIEKHLLEKHGSKWKALNVQRRKQLANEAQKIAADHQICVDDWPSRPTGIPFKNEKLPTKLDAFGCIGCGIIYGHKKLIRRHLKDCTKLPKSSMDRNDLIKPVPIAQRFRPNGPLFEVRERPCSLTNRTGSISMDQLAQAVESLVGDIPDYQARHLMNDFRALSPLLFTTGWLDLLSPYLESDSARLRLIELVKPAGADDEMFNIRQYVEQYLHNCRSEALTVSAEVLRPLNVYPVDPQSTWRPGKVTEESCLRYAHTASKLIVVAIRSLHVTSEQEFSLPLSKEMRKHAIALQRNPSLNSVHKLAIALISLDESAIDENQWACPLMCFFAVHSVKPSGFMSPDDITPYLTSLKYFFRAVVFAECLSISKSEETTLRPTINNLCESLMDIRGGRSWAKLYNLTTELTRLVKKGEGGRPVVTRRINDEAFSYKGKTLHIGQMRQGLRQAFNDLDRLVNKLTTGVDVDIRIPKSFSDDMSETGKEDSFVDKVKIRDLETRLMQLLCNRGLGSCGSDNHICLDRDKVDDWTNTYDELVGLLIAFVHICGGMPARASEEAELHIRNTANGRSQNIFYQNEQILVVHQYTKNLHRTEADSFIPHELPLHLSKVLTVFLLVIVPLRTQMMRVLYWSQGERKGAEAEDKAQSYLEFLYMLSDDRVDGKQISNAVTSFTTKYFKAALGVRGWRQMACHLKNRFIKFDEEKADDVGDRQAGHTSKTAQHHYGKLTDCPAGMRSLELERACEFSRAWHSFLMITDQDGEGENTMPAPVLSRSEGPSTSNNANSSLQEEGAPERRGSITATVREEFSAVHEEISVVREEVFKISSTLQDCFAIALRNGLQESKAFADHSQSAFCTAGDAPAPSFIPRQANLAKFVVADSQNFFDRGTRSTGWTIFTPSSYQSQGQ